MGIYAEHLEDSYHNALYERKKLLSIYYQSGSVFIDQRIGPRSGKKLNNAFIENTGDFKREQEAIDKYKNITYQSGLVKREVGLMAILFAALAIVVLVVG